MWEFFIKNNKFAYLFLGALIALGAFTVVSISRESSPEVIIPIGIVSTVLPGAPAADVESLITNELERGLTNLENVKKISSVSKESISNITVEFEADADIDESIQELKDEVDKIKQDLPTEAEEPFISEVNFVDQPILNVALAGDLSDFAFTALAKDVEAELERLPGVSKVVITGVRDREVTVVVDQTALVKFNLTLNEVISSISNANKTLPIGQIENNNVTYNVAFEGDITDSAQIGNVGITTRGNQPIFVRDVATVIDGLTPATTLSRFSQSGAPSQNSITLNIYKQSGGDITTIAKSVNKRIEELKEPGQLLAELTSAIIYDAGADIEEDLIRLSLSGLQTVTLVILLLVVAIGWREGLLAGTAIPLSFLFGFIGLYFSGNTINFLSLFSLILGIGILVDSAIVMVEGINRRMKDDINIDKREAAIATIREFRAPLISGTLTTVSMFVGLFIVSGVIGQFIASIPFTLIFLLFASMFVSLAIIPLLASSFLKRRSSTKFERKQVEYAHRLETWYRTKLATYLDNKTKQHHFLALISSGLVVSLSLPFSVLAGLIAAPIVYYITFHLFEIQVRRNWSELVRFPIWITACGISIALVVFLTVTFLPSLKFVNVIFFEQSDVEFLLIEIENPEGTTKEITDIATRRVEEVLLLEPAIESYTVTVGSGSEFGSGGTGEKLANMFISLSETRERTSTEITADLRVALAPIRDVKVSVNQPSDGPPTGAAIIVKFLGDDLTELTRVVNETARILKVTPDTTNVETSTNSNNTEFVFELDRAKAASLGLNAFTVSQVIRTALYGSTATSLTTLDDDIDVIVKMNIANTPTVTSDTTNNADIETLARITIPTPQGNIPLSAIVDISLRESSSVINHEDSKRVVAVTADIAGDGNAREIQTEVLKRVKAEVTMSDDIVLSTGGGETDESNKAFLEMLLALVVGIGLMIGILTLQFNSYLHTKYVLSILPYSLIGIMFGLAITQNSLSFPSIMGFIALSGIVVNNSILLIDMMNQMRKRHPERAIREIVLDASSNRLRPILLTTITTVFGMIPLTYAGDLWSPLAYAVMFGLTFCVVITLVLIPIVYFNKPGKVN